LGARPGRARGGRAGVPTPGPESAITIHTVEHSPDDPPPGLSLLPLISGGLAVALVVAVSLSLWQRTDRGSAAPTEGTAPHIGDMADRSAVPAATARAVPPRVYLVESLERQRLLADLGLAENEMVVVVTTEEDAAQARSSLSRPGVTVVDLRTPTAAADGVSR